MILVDTSVWIEVLRARPTIRMAPEDFERVATCPPILQEVLQGVRDDVAHRRLRERMMALPGADRTMDHGLYLEAAEIFRAGRRTGATIRSSADCLIAAIAIRDALPVWHRDRDFARIARFTGLQVVDGL